MGKDNSTRTDNPNHHFRSKLVTIEALFFLIPGMTILYLYYQTPISLGAVQYLIFMGVLCLILCGMLIVRQVFDRILKVQELIKRAEQGEQYAIDLQKDTGELHEISKSFNTLMHNFRKVSNELELRVEEIVQRKQAAEALKRAKEAAEAASMAKSRFLANVSHELLTPLNAIIGFSQMLGAGTHGKLNEIQGRYVKNVETSSQNLLKRILGVLELSRLETGHVETDFSRFNPKTALHHAMGMIEAKAEAKEIRLSSDIAPDLPDMVADQGRFSQVLENLMDNAVKFTPKGGCIVVKAQRVPAAGNSASPPPSSGPDPALVQFTVSDTGIGIRPEDRENLFSLFGQADTSTQRPFAGMGIGLALSRKIVEIHKGRIWVESDGEGKGSRFIFTLPANARA